MAGPKRLAITEGAPFGMFLNRFGEILAYLNVVTSAFILYGARQRCCAL